MITMTFQESKISTNYSYVVNISAGHELHEYTTGCSFQEIEKFFSEENYLKGKRKSIKGSSVLKEKF
jgi:hypothetical protein